MRADLILSKLLGMWLVADILSGVLNFLVLHVAYLCVADEQKRDRRKKIAENRNKRLLSGGATSVDGVVSSTENKSTSPQDGTMRESSSRTMSCTSSEDSSLKQSSGLSPPQHLASPDESSHSVNNRGNGSEQRSPESSTEVANCQRHTSAQSLRSSGESSSSFITEEVPIKKVRSDDELTAASAGKAAVEMNGEKAPAASGHAITQDADLTTIKLMSAENAELVYNMTHAFRQSFDQPVTQPQALKSEGTTLDFLNMADLTIRRLVKMARHLPHFCALDQLHQIDLLRGCSVDVLLLRSVKNFDPSRQGWMTQTSEKKQFVSANTFKSDPTVGAEYYMGYARATVALQDAIRRDAIVLMLVMVLRLFNPKNLEEPDELEAVLARVERSRAAYISATKEYLIVKYDDTDGSLYATIIEKLEAFVLLGTFHHELLKHVKACDLKPLIAEVFDVS
jgi:hypothetical protein